LGRSPAARQMRRGSEWLEALATHEARRAQGAGERRHPPVCVVLTRNDNIVYPQAEQVLPGARVVRLDGVGHLDLVYRRSVWRLVEADSTRLESWPRTVGAPGTGLRRTAATLCEMPEWAVPSESTMSASRLARI